MEYFPFRIDVEDTFDIIISFLLVNWVGSTRHHVKVGILAVGIGVKQADILYFDHLFQFELFFGQI